MTPAAAPARENGRLLRGVWANLRQQGLFLLIVVALWVGAFITLPQVRNGDYLMLLFATYAGVLIMALGQTFVVIQVGFDLSSGALQGFTGGLVFLAVGWGWSDAFVVLFVLGVALLIGAFGHGLLITKAKINFFIVTLASFTILPSLLRVTLSGSSKPVYSPLLDTIANGKLGEIRTPLLVAVVVFVILWVLLNRTVFGRNVYAVGSNREAARLAGVRVDAVTMATYGISSLCAGVAGLLLVGSLGAADPSAGIGNEFLALTAVLLGGTRFSGGHGTLFGTVLGMTFLVLLSAVLQLSGMPQFWIGTVQGAVLLIAVAIDRARRHE